MKSVQYTLLAVLLVLSFTSFSQNNITITDDNTHNADETAVLDVFSTSKGMLVPRMSTEQINLIAAPATGLLIFNTDENSFWFFNGSSWDDLSSGSAGLWDVNTETGDVFLKNGTANVGIGTNTPLGKLTIRGNAGSVPENPLFEVKDEFGQPIFTVSSEGVRVYVKDVAKGVGGGFAVGKYGIAKDLPDTTLLLVTADSTRIYTRTGNKGVGGGFAVGKYGIAKLPSQKYMYITDENYFIGDLAGASNTTGLYNSFMGYQAGMENTEGYKNIFIGYKAGNKNTKGYGNIMLGDSAGFENDSGRWNVFIGSTSGKNNINGNYNCFVGYQSGISNTSGMQNTFIGYRSGINNSTGYLNTIIGGNTCIKLSTGRWNTIIGAAAGNNITNNNSNTFVGYYSGRNIAIGLNNTILGAFACYSTDTMSYSVVIGHDSGRYSENGVRNVFIGEGAGLYSRSANSIYIGYNSGANYYQTLQICNDNVFIGNEAGISNETGALNLFIGNSSGYSNLSGSQNLFIGYYSGNSNLSGSGNVYLGNLSGSNKSSGDFNTFIGTYSGKNNYNGNNNVFIGVNSGYWETNSNRLYIENTEANSIGALIYGEFDNDKLRLNAQVNIRDFMVLEPQSAPPTTPSEGTVYYDINDHKIKAWDGTSWQTLW